MNMRKLRTQPGALRVLVIGAGPAGTDMHLPVLARLRDRGDLVLAVVCDLQPQRASAAMNKFGFLEHTGDAVGALGRSDLDAVYILASAQLHHEYGMVALRNGKHLFVEKPIAPTYAQAIEMAGVARAQGLIAAGGHNRRFYQSIAEVRKRSGKTGWRSSEAVFHKAEFAKVPQFGARTWLGANGIHALDAQIFVMGGLPQELAAMTGEKGAARPSVFSAVMRWKDGAQGTFLCNNDAGSRREQYVFHAPGQTLTVSEKGLAVAKDGKVEEMPFPSVGDGIAAEHEAFLHATRSGEQPLHSLEAIAPSLLLAELIEAGFSGRVEIPVAGSVAAQRCEREGKSILISNGAGLQTALARWLPGYRLATLDDLYKCAEVRSDIVAAILGRGASPLPPDVLEKLPQLEVVGVVALSLARHAPEALLALDVALLNASEAYATSVAEFALALAILARRRAFFSHELMRRGGWGTHPELLGLKALLRRSARRSRRFLKTVGLEAFSLKASRAVRARALGSAARTASSRELQGATVGLIGWGANARAFTERLVQARAHVSVYSEHAVPSEIQKSGATPASLGQVLASDIVSLHRGLNQATLHCLGAAELEKLRSGAVLINVARGALIEPGALLARLRRGDIFACLDTFEEEPLAASHPLRSLPNVFLTSHIAGGSEDMHAEAAEEVVRKVAQYLAGSPIESIGAERLRTMT